MNKLPTALLTVTMFVIHTVVTVVFFAALVAKEIRDTRSANSTVDKWNENTFI